MHILRLLSKRRNTGLVVRLPLSSSDRGNEAYGPTSTAPSKTDVHKQTKWQQTGGEGGTKEEEGGGRGGGDTVQKWNVFMFSCPTNGSYFPLLRSTWTDIARDTVWAVKQTFAERSLDGQFVLLHPVLFYNSRDTVCVFTGMDGNSLWRDL